MYEFSIDQTQTPQPNVRIARLAREPNDVKKMPSLNSQKLAVGQMQQEPTTSQPSTLHDIHNRQQVKEDGLTRLRPLLGSQDADTERRYDLDIVAIHGLGGHRRDTWMDKKSKVAWLEDLLPTDLPNARIFTYGYNAKVQFSKSISDIYDWATALLQELSLEREKSYEVSCPAAGSNS